MSPQADPKSSHALEQTGGQLPEFQTVDMAPAAVVKHYSDYYQGKPVTRDGITTLTIPVKEGLVSVTVREVEGRTVVTRSLLKLHP